jgi:hypothetical protein
METRSLVFRPFQKFETINGDSTVKISAPREKKADHHCMEGLKREFLMRCQWGGDTNNETRHIEIKPAKHWYPEG